MQKNRFTLKELKNYLETKNTLVELIGNGECVVDGVSDLESATGSDISFFANPRYENAMKQSKAAALVLSKSGLHVFSETERLSRSFLCTDDPSRAFQELVELFSTNIGVKTSFTGIHPTAVVHTSAKIGQNVTLGPYVVIEAEAEIGDGTLIGAHSYVGYQTKVGKDCVLYQHVTVRECCILKNRVVIQPGAVIGSCGFGFTTDKMGRHTKLNQVGNVVIEDDVEIGANTTIDRARFQSTVIGEGTKIDNLVQIAHGVCLGKHNLIISQTGIAGSTETGNHVVLAGQVAVNGHIKLADGVMVAARSGVSKSLLKAGKYGGVPAMALGDYNRMAVHLQNIEAIVDDVKALKKAVDCLHAKKVE